MRAVRFDDYGSEDVLYIATDVARPTPKDDEVLVQVHCAGVQSGEVHIRSGEQKEAFPATFPSGQGTELAGVIDSVGAKVTGVAAGDPVIGWSDVRAAQADFAVVPTKNLVAKPDALDWVTAAAIVAPGATSVSSMEVVRPAKGDTVVVAGGAGSVGSVAIQLASRAGARVITTGSTANHEALRQLGAEPVEYGDGAADAIRELAPDGVDGFADCHGGGNLQLAIDLGVPHDRINTIIDYEQAQKLGVTAQGMYDIDIQQAISDLIPRVLSGEITIPIKARFPMDEVRDAYRRLARSGGVGSVMLDIDG